MVEKEKKPHFPYALKENYEKNKKELIKAISKDGMKPKDAVALIYGVQDDRYSRWVKLGEEDLENGFTKKDSKLLELLHEIAKADGQLKRRLSRKGIDIALYDEEKGSDMLKFLLKSRAGYNQTQKSEVELSGNKSEPVVINITGLNDKE